MAAAGSALELEDVVLIVAEVEVDEVLVVKEVADNKELVEDWVENWVED